jgi:hypothetical protein
MYGDSLRQPPTISDARRGGALLVALILLVCPAGVLRTDEAYQAATPPRVMHFCWANCFTLTFNNGLYRRADGTDETWTVERFTSTSVILRRHDVPAAWNGFSADVAYQGQESNDRLTSVTVNGHLVPDIGVAWGVAFDTLPGSNAERDQRTSAQSQAQAQAQAQAQPQAQTQAFAVNSPPPPDDIEPALDVDASAADAPPPLLNYEQSPLPEDGYLWTPGYWGWGGAGYYWVPGAWVRPPRVGLLWTPGYWAFVGAVYVFHVGYWDPQVGYYGGINYGYGYVGSGFAGGRWVGNSFAYNRAVSNVNASVVHNTYTEAVVNHATAYGVSYNGGPGGSSAIPTAQERAAAAEPHMPATPRQRQIVRQSAGNPELMARAFVDHPVVAAANRPAAASAPGVVGARNPAAPAVSGQHDRTHARPSTAVHSRGVAQHSVAPDSMAHPQGVAEHVAAPGTTSDPQGDAEHAAAVKHTGATPARPQHPSSK